MKIESHIKICLKWAYLHSFTGSSSRRIPNNRSRLRGSGFRKNQSATAKAGKIYNSYNDFKISKYPKGSPQWQAEVIKYLLDMKAHGHRIKTVETNKVSHFISKVKVWNTQHREGNLEYIWQSWHLLWDMVIKTSFQQYAKIVTLSSDIYGVVQLKSIPFFLQIQLMCLDFHKDLQFIQIL